jgi:acyl-CoA synthetase (AMP-forming)/AMP-acid ligase II
LPAEWLPEEHGLRVSEGRPAIPGDGAQSVAELLDPIVASDPAREALVGRQGRYSYAELDREANRAARALQTLGVEAGDRVAACLPNDVDIVVAFLAVQRLGAVWVGVNRVLAAPEKAYLLGDSNARVCLVQEEVRAEIEEHRRDLGSLEQVVTVAPKGEADEWRETVAGQSDDPLAERPLDPFGPAAIAYTSGTTGFPKGAVHSQHNILLPGAATHLLGGRRATPRHGVVLPLTILNLMVLGPVKAFYAGTCCICIDRIDPLGLAAWVREERVNSFDGVPTIIHDLLTHPEVGEKDLLSLTHPGVGGADMPPALVKLYRERFQRPVTVGYGMTEAPTAVTWHTSEGTPEPGLCGAAVPQVALEIVDEANAALPSGEIGEICIRPAEAGPLAGVYTPMLGYWNKPEATAEALRGGRYHTGDLGFLDEAGLLHVRGRRNELILRGGANVYPAEIERVLAGHPAVAAAAVLGVADPRLGERVVAAVELEEGARGDEQSLRDHVRASLARYKVPDVIRVIDALPRNAMNKVVKPRLRPLFLDEPGDAD